MSDTKYKFGVYIGRFQPFHKGHRKTVKDALKQVDTLVIVLGSDNIARNPKNPFTARERSEMIKQSLTWEFSNKKITIITMPDMPYDEDGWVALLKERAEKEMLAIYNGGSTVHLHGLNDFDITLFGCHKDSSSFYLDSFGDWDYVEMDHTDGVGATDIRADYFRSIPLYSKQFLPKPVRKFLKTFRHTSNFAQLLTDRQYYDNYPNLWGKGPFLTADTLVECVGNILLVTRGQTPGKGLYALPGGFVNPDETFEQAASRELHEETCLEKQHEIIRSLSSRPSMADNPSRSLRGKVISAVFHIEVCQPAKVELPAEDRLKSTFGIIEAGDDAANAGWYDFSKLSPNDFFEDHWFVINEMLKQRESSNVKTEEHHADGRVQADALSAKSA